MATRELKILTNHMSCPICYHLYKDPKVLPCQHSYCQECLNKLEKDKQVTCPECREVAQVPDGGVEEFKTNFLINRLVDDCILKRKVDGEEEVHCEACIEDDCVMTFCPECVLFMCQACDNNHKRSRNTHQHPIISLTDLPSTRDVKDKDKPKKQVLLCKKHDIELKFYCETCEELVCLYCTVKDHSTHSHDAIKEVADTHRENLKKTTAALKDMITKLSHASNNIVDTKEKMLEQHEVVDKQIGEHYDKILRRITDDVSKQCQQLKQDLQNTVKTKIVALNAQLEKVKSVHDNVMSIDQIAREVEESSNVEMLSGEQQVIRCVSEVTDTFSKLKTDPVELYKPYFTPSYPNTFPQFGCVYNIHPLQCKVVYFSPTVIENDLVKFYIIVKDVKEIPLNTEAFNFIVQLKHEWNNGNTLMDYRDGQFHKNECLVTFTVKFAGQYQLSVSIRGEQIKGSPLSFFVSRDYSALNLPRKVIIIDKRMVNPWGVAVNSNHHWAVSDHNKHCVYIFDQHDQLVKEFGCKGCDNGQFCNPCGVSFDSDNFLYVVDKENHRVQKFNLNGDYFLQFGEKGRLDGHLKSPTGIAVHLDKVYIVDRGNQRISVYQTDGTYCFSFGSVGNGAGQFENPWDVAITPDNTLCVADVGNARIQLYQLNGTFINRFGSQGTDKGQLDFPSSIAVDPNGFILVTEVHNNRVSVFDKQHNFLHSFSSHNPRGIAISCTGTVYVSNYNNSKIDVY